jgi:hypothetical protein
VPPPGHQEHGIAMWGAPGSGKTTFLGALNVALARGRADWRLVGRDRASTEVLTRLTSSLAAERRFPQATVGMEHLRWDLVGARQDAARRRRGTQPAGLAGIGLEFIDARGEIFADESGQYPEAHDSLIDNLAASSGIIYLFDPIREMRMGDTFQHTFRVLAELSSSMVHSPRRIDGRLPHYVAICVTKFDEPQVLMSAETLDLLVADPDDQFGFPRVGDEDARELLSSLCGISPSGNADLAVNGLLRCFLPGRVRFFVTSAIGFHVDPASGAYDPEDFQNVVPDEAFPAQSRIRGSVHPINVLEPVLWLATELMRNDPR